MQRTFFIGFVSHHSVSISVSQSDVDYYSCKSKHDAYLPFLNVWVCFIYLIFFVGGGQCYVP